LIEKLKKKVQAKTQKIRRKWKTKIQYTLNKMLKEDTKQFYRHLGARTIEIKAHPHMEKVELYWKSLWGKK